MLLTQFISTYITPVSRKKNKFRVEIKLGFSNFKFEINYIFGKKYDSSVQINRVKKERVCVFMN